MIGSSRTSLAVVKGAVDASFGDPALAQAGRDLLAVADLLFRERSLRKALAESGRSDGDRKQIVERLIGSSISPLALELTKTIVAQRWSSDADLFGALEIAGSSALLATAERAGASDRVEEELFRFSRIVDADSELQMTLSGVWVPQDAKRGIVADLLGGRAHEITAELTAFAVTHLRGRRIDAVLQSLVELAAVRRGEVSAVVRSAVPLSDEQRARLLAVLTRIYGRPAQLSVDVDPDVVGGISVQVGDEIIDGTLATKIAHARRRLAG